MLGASLLACGPQGLTPDATTDGSVVDFADPEIEGIPELAYLPLTAAQNKCVWDDEAKKVTWPMEQNETLVLSLGAVDKALYANSTRCDTTVSSGVPVTVNDFKQIEMEPKATDDDGLVVILDFVNGTFGSNNGGNPGIVLSPDDNGEMTLKVRGTRNADNYMVGKEGISLAVNRRVDIAMGDSADTITGLAGVVFSLGAGSDRFTGQGTEDLGGRYDADKLQVFGGSGADFIDGGSGDDELHGGDDNDTISGFGGADELYGDNGNDVFKEVCYSEENDDGDLEYEENGGDKFFGGLGDDTVDYSSRDDDPVHVDMNAKIGAGSALTIDGRHGKMHGEFTIAGVASTSVVTLSSFKAHNLEVGDLFTLSECTTSALNGTHPVKTVPSATSFTYSLALAADVSAETACVIDVPNGRYAHGELSVVIDTDVATITVVDHDLKVGEKFVFSNCATSDANDKVGTVTAVTATTITADLDATDVDPDTDCRQVAAGEGDYVNSGDGDANSSSIEAVRGGGGDDQFLGTAVAETFFGGAGDDRFNGGGGDDELNGDSGDDYFIEHYELGTISGNLTASATTADDGCEWTTDDAHTLEVGDSVLVEDCSNADFAHCNGRYKIESVTGTDKFKYTAATDITTASTTTTDCSVTVTGDTEATGADFIVGGAGTDTVDYSLRSQDLGLTLDAQANDGQADELDNIRTDIENIIGGVGDDTITGSSANNQITGGQGDDVLTGGAGDDTFVHSFTGGDGEDTIDGGAGYDMMDYSAIDATDGTSLLAHLDGFTKSGAQVTADPGDEGDLLKNMEDIKGSATAPNEIYGNDEDNVIIGGSHNDKIYAMGGDDFIDIGAQNSDAEFVSCGSGQGDLLLSDNTPTWPGLLANILAYGNPKAVATESTIGGTLTTNLDIENGELDGKVLYFPDGTANKKFMRIESSFANGNLVLDQIHEDLAKTDFFLVLDPHDYGQADGAYTANTVVQDLGRTFVTNDFDGAKLVQLKTGAEGEIASNTADTITTAAGLGSNWADDDYYAVFREDDHTSVANCEL